MLLHELRIKARELKIKGRSKMNKAQLIKAVNAKLSGPPDTAIKNNFFLNKFSFFLNDK